MSPHGDVRWIGAPHASHYNLLADWETNLKKKRNLLQKALREGFHGLGLAESTGYPRVIRQSHAILASALASLALVETNSDEKRGLLEKALEHRNESVRIDEQCYPFEYFNLGVHRVVAAFTKGELSDFEKDPESRKNMLEEAISSVEQGLRLIIEDLRYWEKRGVLVQFAPLGKFQYKYGEMVIRLYQLTNNVEHQRKAIKAFEVAAESFQKLSLFSRLAECHWKVARSYDALGEHLKAAEIFTLVSNSYGNAAQKIPQLKDFYQDYRRYMEAWREIEKAKHNHRQQEYSKAKEYYEKVAVLHESTERWDYLGPNYLAWARLEEAEDLSRKEQTEEAQKLFQQAAGLFTEAEESIHTKLETMEAKDEREMAAELIKASDIRRDYCLGRSALEEAKTLDRQGDHAASSTKYGDAADKFQKATNATDDELDRRELRPIVFLCQAWQTMTQAEAEVSPDLYLEASQLFDTAKEYSLDEKAKMLALGHSSFCKALEAGTRFETIKDATLYSTAKKHIEAATNHYLKAGFRNASEYAKATYRLFDAYMYMYKAQTETDPRKKAQYYQMAEKLLQASAGSFMMAKHPEKSDEVERILESVKEERELTLSLAEVLHVPTIASTTASFSTPTPTHEQAVGLERFEHADIQANLILRVTEVKVDEDVEFRVELVNAGKAPALLIKVDEVVPEGFEIKHAPETYSFEDSYVNLKGKRLNPLKTEDVRIVVNPRSKGTFTVKPRVLYIDETGKYKSHEPEPATITVRELGIRSWIKGER